MVDEVAMDIMVAEFSGATVSAVRSMEGIGMIMVGGERHILLFNRELGATGRPEVFRIEAVLRQSLKIF